MRNFIAISFILLYLFSNTELGELVKLPVLIHHYFEHEREHRQGIFNFLKNHYAELHKTGDKHHEEHHKQLPFKSNDHNFLTTSISIVPRIYTYVETSVYCDAKKASLINESSYYSHFLSDIWQPPRV